jgi:hypothetical protein
MERSLPFFGSVGLAIACLMAACGGGDVPVHEVAPSERPRGVDGPSVIAPEELCAGAAHSCVRLRDGRVACWGDNVRHQTSEDDRATTARPRIVGFPPAVALFCGAYETCVLTDGGSVHCIGGPEDGVEQVRLSAPGTGLVLGRTHGCVAQRDGRVYCWRGDRPRSESLEAVMSDATSVAPNPSGHGRVCAARAGARPVCFRPEAPADTIELDDRAPPSAEADRRRASGDEHSCEIDVDGVRCWGAGSRGQLGTGRAYEHAEPARVVGIVGATALDVGSLHACAASGIETGRQRTLLQHSRSTELGPAHFAPFDARFPDVALEVRVGEPDSTCARSARGSWCLEAGWRRCGRAAQSATSSLAGIRVRHMSSDGSCGITSDHRAVCRTGVATASESTGSMGVTTLAFPEPPAELSATFAVAGTGYVCARTESGRVMCVMVTENAAVESPSIEALEDVVQIRAGTSEEAGLVCVLTSAGRVACWGDHRFGQLGPASVGRHPDAFEAVPIGGLPPVLELGVGGNYACARTHRGEVWCWGSNRDGTAPDGASGAPSGPVSVVGPPEGS